MPFFEGKPYKRPRFDRGSILPIGVGALGGYALTKFNRTNAHDVGGGSTLMQVVSRRRGRMGSRNSFAQKVRRVAAAYHNTQSDAGLNQVLVHNTIYTNTPTANIIQGTSNANRQGDSIWLEAIKIMANIQTPVTVGAFSYRLIVGYSGEEYSNPNTWGSGAAGLTSAEIFLPNTNVNWNPNGIINPKTFTVLHDEIIDINSVTDTSADVHSIARVIQLKTQFKYQNSASTLGKDRNLYIVFIGSVAGGLGGAGTLVMATDLIFKNE